jgi:hypothetical protein
VVNLTQEPPMKLTKLAILLCTLTLAARQLSAQACGNSTLNAADPLLSYSPWTIHFSELARLGNQWMPTFGNGDSMTEPLWLTGGANPGYGSAGFQETWYIPRTNLANTAPLYRLYSPTNLDHMDWTSAISGYTTEFTHGYPWTYQAPGTLPISRYLKGSISDHRTWLNSQVPSGYAVDAILSTANGLPRYGYERFGNLLDLCSVLSAAYRDSLSNSLIRIDFNKIWGNGIGKITYSGTTPAKQVVASDIGAMVQSTLLLATSLDTTTCCIINPTESGGVDGTQYGYTQLWAGSPTLSVTTTGGAIPSLNTVLKPINFNNYVFQGEADRYSPLLWNGVFNRTTTLGYVAGSTTYPDVIKLQFGAKLDNSNMASYYTEANMNNTFWFEMSAIGTYNTLTYEWIDLPSQVSTPVAQQTFANSVWICNGDLGQPCPKYRGLVVASADGTFAIGVTRRETTATAAPLALKIQWICSGGSQGLLSCNADPQVFFDIFQNHSLSATAYQNEDSFMVLGTKATVRSRLHQIYCQETGLCTP